VNAGEKVGAGKRDAYINSFDCQIDPDVKKAKQRNMYLASLRIPVITLSSSGIYCE